MGNTLLQAETNRTSMKNEICGEIFIIKKCSQNYRIAKMIEITEFRIFNWKSLINRNK